MAAGVVRVGIRFGKDGVIPVAGIDRVNGDQINVAQILALAEGGQNAPVSFGNHGIGELVGDAVLVNGNQADGAGTRRVAQPRGDAGLRQAHVRACRPTRPRPTRHPWHRG